MAAAPLIPLTHWLSVAPSHDTPHASFDGEGVRCLGASDDSGLAAAAQLLVEECKPLIALAPALPLAAALLVVRERRSLQSALELLAEAGCAVSALPATTVAVLAQLELSEMGVASDLTAIAGAPPEWMWLRWRTAADALTVVSRGRVMHARRLRPEPRMAFVSGFLSEAECEHIIQLGRSGGELHPSRVVNYEGGKGELSPYRSSESCRVSAGKDRVVMRAVQRAAYLTGLSPAHAEAVQVVHYEPGGQYRPHYDYFSPADANYARKCSEQGNRLISFFVYLSTCAGGGRTYFPKLRVGFEPQPGSAVCWYNLDRHGNMDDRTLHAGEPVTVGDKWGMNIWLRERTRPSTAARRGGALRATLRIAPPKVTPSTAAASGAGSPSGEAGTDVCVVLELRWQPPRPVPSLSVQPCPKCSDPVGPIGLCLCTANYVVGSG